MPTLYYTDYSNPDVTQQRIVSQFIGLDLHLQQIPNKYSPVALVDDKLVVYEPNAVSLHLASGSKLLGSSFEDQIDVYSWLEYFNLEIYPLLVQTYDQIFGKQPSNEKKYNYAFEELKKVIRVLDQKLKLRTYIVGDSITLVDVILCCHFDRAFRLILSNDVRKKFINVARWFTTVRTLRPLQNCIGKMYLCDTPFKVNFQTIESQGQTAANQPSDKKEEQKKNKVEQKTEKGNKKKEQKKETKKEQKKQKPVQQKTEQKEGQFNLDTFKRAFQNSQNKEAVIDELLANFGPGWSIWKVYYSKDVTEGKVDYLTCNLAKGTLQRLDQLRKTGFGNWGVYLNEETKQYEIRGVMLWKGQDVATAWKEHPSHQYHIFQKLDPKNPEHQKIVKDYWLQRDSCEGLSLHNSYKLI